MDCSGCNKCTEVNCSIDTKCQQLDRNLMDQFGAISFPIYQTATFAHPGLGQSTGYDYTRMQNPTRKQLESIVAYLENGKDAIAFSSGMAAIATIMELFKPGDHFIIDEDLYGGSIRLFNEISRTNGLEYTAVNLSRDNVRKYIKENLEKRIYFDEVNNRYSVIWCTET